MNNIPPPYINGRPVILKTCQVWIKDASNAKKRRRGRFYLRYYQHRNLISKNGLYAFLLFNKEGKLLCSKLVDASTFPLKNREKWEMTWTKIFDDFDYQPEKEGDENAA